MSGDAAPKKVQHCGICNSPDHKHNKYPHKERKQFTKPSDIPSGVTKTALHLLLTPWSEEGVPLE